MQMLCNCIPLVKGASTLDPEVAMSHPGAGASGMSLNQAARYYGHLSHQFKSDDIMVLLSTCFATVLPHQS